MALVGAAIVFSGLVVLSFVISQIHKILNLWDKRDELLTRPKEKFRPDGAQTVAGPVYRERRLPTVDELVSIYRPLVEQLKEPFDLVQLYEISYKMDLPHPNLSINKLREANILVAQGDGRFTWSK
ncbi:MAG: OadG family protein [Desulfobacterales bacterium]|nr:MAG: OadG family protein [Desulfobacterales bacterium]